MTNIDSHNLRSERSALAHLRSLVPNRALQFSEALRIAELQASHLLELGNSIGGAIPTELVTELPRVWIDYRDLPASGMSYWSGQAWIICLNRAEPRTRQRFTLFHEFKHILDHDRADRLYCGNRFASAEVQAEQAADYFAGCALMPKRLIKRAWGDGIQRTTALGALFEVSPRAMDVRLAQLGLTDPRPRCAHTTPQRYRTPPRGTYLRQLPASTPVHRAIGVAV